VKILVRGTNWIGDAAMSVPALRRLRSVFPEAHISLLTRDWAEGVFQDADFVDEIITIDGAIPRIRSIFRQVRDLRRRKFDLSILLPNSFESALVVRLGGTKRVYGYSTDGRRLLLTDPVAVPEWKNTRHEVFYYLNLVDAVARDTLGTAASFDHEPDTSLAVSDVRQQAARAFLTELGINRLRPIVALAPGSKNSRAKRWSPDRYAELAARLIRELGANVILVGATDERDISETVSRLSAENVVDLTGKTSLAEAAAVLSVCDLLVANDMGLAHLAPAAGTQTLVIFGPTDPRTTRPFGKNVAVARVDVECSPCMLRDCPIDHRCMTRISVDDIFQMSRRLLDSSLEENE